MSKICSYAQGFAQMRAASEEYGWKIPYGNVAMIFRGGCIIRARFLQNIKDAFDQNNDLIKPISRSILSRDCRRISEFASRSTSRSNSARNSSSAFSSALAYYDSYRTESLPAKSNPSTARLFWRTYI